ncbi:MAG TPA: class I SAM-dependent methyltransferase [Micropepsaceae bacterium]|nr:class I SAM-dependent methyltransferase [Micropepsaceae bacterium]
MGAIAAKTTISWNAADGASHEGPLVTRKDGFDVIACDVCGFRHVIPLPDPSALEQAYREAYYTVEKPTFLSHAGEDQEWASLAQRDRLESFERLLPPNRRRILDIGCGPGFFLKTAQERGWIVRGLEPSRQAAEHARGLGIAIVEDFFSARTAASLGHYDAVHLNNVLEHVPNPLTLMRLARDLLTPGGVLCLNVPNDFTPFQEGARSSLSLPEWWVAPPHHLNYFDFESLSHLVTRLGFAVVERGTSFPMELFLLMGLDYTSNPELGLNCHNQRKRFDLGLEKAGFRETRRRFYRALAEAGIGREAVIIAVKQ